jgi:hypothetical protein
VGLAGNDSNEDLDESMSMYEEEDDDEEYMLMMMHHPEVVSFDEDMDELHSYRNNPHLNNNHH